MYDSFFHAGEVVEIRAIDVDGTGPWKGRARGTVSGYFNNAKAFADAAKALDDAGAKGVYFTINPCNPGAAGQGEQPPGRQSKKHHAGYRYRLFAMAADRPGSRG